MFRIAIFLALTWAGPVWAGCSLDVTFTRPASGMVHVYTQSGILGRDTAMRVRGGGWKRIHSVNNPPGWIGVSNANSRTVTVQASLNCNKHRAFRVGYTCDAGKTIKFKRYPSAHTNSYYPRGRTEFTLPIMARDC